jgi:hypothetical protein
MVCWSSTIEPNRRAHRGGEPHEDHDQPRHSGRFDFQVGIDARRKGGCRSGPVGRHPLSLTVNSILPVRYKEPLSDQAPPNLPPFVTKPATPPNEARKATSKLLRAGWHPIQYKALHILTERVASPKEIAIELGLTSARASNVDYHVKQLQSQGLVELVRTEPRRGVSEHFYRATKPLIVMDDEAERMSLGERLAFSCWIIRNINGDFARAVEAETIDARTDRHLSRFPLRLDEEGYLDLVGEQNQVFHRTLEIASQSEERRLKSGEEGMPISASMGVFQIP